MDIERNLIITVLRLTKDGPVSLELVNKEARIPSDLTQKLLKGLQDESLIYFRRGHIDIDGFNRLKLAIRAINLGADPERVSALLQWKEFEAMAAATMEGNGYAVARNLRFKRAGRRWETDIIACKRPLVVCADCKHWRHGISPSTLRIVVREQVERTMALAECLRDSIMKIECSTWSSVKLVPAIFSLTVGSVKLVDNVPVVPILQLRDFLGQLPAYADTLEHLVVSHDINHRLSDEP